VEGEKINEGIFAEIYKYVIKEAKPTKENSLINESNKTQFLKFLSLLAKNGKCD
jgi:hypothetical protein